MYSTFLLWMLSELYELLPEQGDKEMPRIVFFFDEAHLLFNNCSKNLLEKVEQVVRLIRSKGVGVYFVTQSPADIPDSILGQLGHRVQHALRAYTPRDQKAVKTVAETMRPNPALDIGRAILELGVGEALVSFLDEKGRPTMTERVWMASPGSRIGPVSEGERRMLLRQSLVAGVYEQAVDRESAYEILQADRERVAEAQAAPQGRGRAQAPAPAQRRGAPQQPAPQQQDSGLGGDLLGKISDMMLGSTGPRGGHREGMVEAIAKSVIRSQGRKIVNSGINAIVRGVFGTMLGGGRRR
ncbi:MAG: DUF853 family protein, partial [Duodenibacillus sp.]|nr:DUF853 family protein [Duodenibacillus sp.]